jgi:GntR family transcriptional repressor for pyruvate dehydrogenase complex
MVCFWTNRGTFDPVEGDAALAGVFEPVRPATTFEETVERLGTAIRLGLLPPGSRLPSERDLADQLRISRSTLRQALTTLVQSGHLVSARGRTGGTFVAERPPLAEVEDKPLGDEAWAVLDYRVAVETGATILAAERGKPEQFERLRELVEQMAKVTDFEEYRRADIRFHIGISEAAGSPRLVRAMTEVQGQMSDLISLIPHPEQVLTHSNAQHKRLVTLLSRRQAGAAVGIMREHIEGTEHILAGLI